jgi:hypothetical protein
MKLSVTNSKDNPCLFVCRSDGFTCAGTEHPLNLVLSAPLAGGFYDFQNGAQYPMLATSSNGGAANSWKYAIDSKGSLPADYIANGVFIDTSCSETACIAVGQYDTDTGTYPMIAVSTQGGARNTWKYVIDVSSNLPNEYDGFASFDSASCSNTICVAGGQYSDDDGNTFYPMLAVSTQSGASGSWKYVVDNTVATFANTEHRCNWGRYMDLFG